MMEDLKLYLRYALRILLWLAPLEFLLGRFIARASRQAPTGEVAGAIFGAISSLGAFLVAPAALMLVAVLTIAAVLGREAGAGSDGEGARWPRFLGPALLGLMAFSAVLLFTEATIPLLVAGDFLSALVVVGAGAVAVVDWRSPLAVRIFLGLVTASYICYYLYAILGGLAQGFDNPEIGAPRIPLNQLGEAAAMAAALNLLWIAGPFARRVDAGNWWRSINYRRLVVALLPAIIYLISVRFESWMQSVIITFSVGFTLFLPAPISAAALVAYIYALLTLFSKTARQETGLPWAWEMGAGLLLLPVAGYLLQLNYQHLVLAVTMLLLTGLIRPFSTAASATEVFSTKGAAQTRAEV